MLLDLKVEMRVHMTDFIEIRAGLLLRTWSTRADPASLLHRVAA
jgi:hypothetical protein